MSGKNQRPRPRKAQPLRALRQRLLVTALACLAGQGAAFAHLVLVQHATCVEHDALVHSDRGDARQSAPPPAHSTEALDAPPLDVGHEDDHCLAVSLRRREAPAGGGVTVAPIESAVEHPALPRPLDRSVGVPLLLLAPKSSPPSPPASLG